MANYHSLIKEQELFEQQMLKQYSEVHESRQEMKEVLFKMLSTYNTQVVDENYANTDHLEIAKKLQQSMSELNGFSALNEPCAKLVKLYMQYQISAKINITALKEKLVKEWISMEQKWFYWNESDFIHWIRYKFDWFDDKSIPKGVNLTSIQQRMKDAHFTGQGLGSMQKKEMFEFFGMSEIESTVDHKYQIVNNIFIFLQQMCAKYPLKKIKNVNKNSRGDGFLEDTGAVDEIIEIPETFKCKISNQLMSDPVVAFDGYTYDRDAIISYLKTHRKSPVTGDVFEGNMDEGNEISSNEAFMLFDDEEIKQEIELFRVTHDL